MALKQVLSIVLMVLLVGSVFFGCLGVSKAESITKPSVPKFTIAYVDSSYDVPATTSTNPYSGEEITHPGYHVENRTIILQIDNRPFTSYLNKSPPEFYYNVRERGRFAQDWTELYTPNSGFLRPSNSDFTVVSYWFNELSDGGTVDFQVQAMAGGLMRISPRFSSGDEFVGITSDWSTTQTVDIQAKITASPVPTSQSSPSIFPPTGVPTSSSVEETQDSLLIWLLVGVVVGLVVVLLVVVTIMSQRIRRLEQKLPS